MSEALTTRRWGMRLAYVLLALAIIFFQLLPLETTPRRWTGPDLLILITFAWAVRRPDYLPAFLVASNFLLGDFLFQRPPGLLAALTVLAVEALKRRSRSLRDQTFLVEWLTVSVMLIVLMLSDRMVLAVLLIPQSPMGLTLVQLIMTIIAYPLVAAVSHSLFGVRRIAANDAEALRAGL
ncbi:rod shape-determining protein MreD [Thalassovita aquimarina]|uniref:Rod shape-determining protein MreD n=1 Tax=Thalassovita aquimarina TaxID=2785917 RepID=A0ABS5HPQ2_9RHOB|nr:rod shape-determining protein MreD [Thalassovita aquimarina]MBR9650935.1 rod shape-determining protein MreD [Thalassovita aquimarina]